MQENIIDMIESTPKLHSRKCKGIALLLKIFLQFSTVLSGLLTWYLYDYFIAIAVLLVTFIVIGIIRSKLRNEVIPANQQEYQYNDKGIADWFTAKKICNDELEIKLENI